MLNVPVALSVFNRPESTELVFRSIARARPRQLFVFADGPRSSDEAELCARARAVAERVDWDCDVSYDVSDVNLGARRRYASGVDWVFAHVDEAIVLDDDCVPDPTFFPFCEEVLQHYRDDPRVMMVSGSNYLERWHDDRQSFHFSHFGGVWGWATWKRAWDLYDIDMKAWSDPQVRRRIRELVADDEIFEFQAARFDRVADPAERHSWDLPWYFARLAHAGLTVVPAVNLVANVGNADGRGIPPAHPLAKLRAAPMPFPLRFPPAVAADRVYDGLHVRRIFEWWDDQARVARPRTRSGAVRHRIARSWRASLSRMRARLGSRTR